MRFSDAIVWPIARLALVSVLVPMVSATGGASLLNLAYGVPFGEAWENVASRLHWTELTPPE